MKKCLTILFLLASAFIMNGCKETMVNPNYPTGIINFTIYPNTLHYADLNIISGWMYLTSDPESTSRGIIVYRLYQDEFRAYDRLPPNEPNACCDNEGNCTRLVVDFPFVVDNCNRIKYNIIDGSIVQGDGIFPLIQYHTTYDGNELHIYN
ncbi:MAG: hypothetical protein IKM95_05250 [Bacteroidales bacterium]|nr:hypothetical protein [Bacteroidales bacterium]